MSDERFIGYAICGELHPRRNELYLNKRLRAPRVCFEPRVCFDQSPKRRAPRVLYTHNTYYIHTRFACNNKFSLTTIRLDTLSLSVLPEAHAIIRPTAVKSRTTIIIAVAARAYTRILLYNIFYSFFGFHARANGRGPTSKGERLGWARNKSYPKIVGFLFFFTLGRASFTFAFVSCFHPTQNTRMYCTLRSNTKPPPILCAYTYVCVRRAV